MAENKAVDEGKFLHNGVEMPIQCIELCAKHTGGQITSAHFHEYIELLFGIDCDVDVIIGDENLKMKNGDIVIINSLAVHGFRHNLDENKYFVIKFSPQIFYSAAQSVFELKYIYPFISTDKTKHLIKSGKIKNTRIPEALREIMQEWKEEKYGYEIAVRASVIRVVLGILRIWHAEGESFRYGTECTEVMQRKLQKALEYTMANYAEATASKAAEYCGVSYSYLSRMFKNVMKTGYSDYLSEVRLSEAKRLLAATDKSVTDIAYETGYSTTSYFIEQFKKSVGITPKKFRELSAEKTKK